MHFTSCPAVLDATLQRHQVIAANIAERASSRIHTPGRPRSRSNNRLPSITFASMQNVAATPWTMSATRLSSPQVALKIEEDLTCRGGCQGCNVLMSRWDCWPRTRPPPGVRKAINRQLSLLSLGSQ